MATTAARLEAAVRAWLDGLDDVQRAAATFPFEIPERFVWAYTPGPREGLAIRDMRPAHREAALAIVAAATSARGAGEIVAVMALETILREVEQAAGRPSPDRRDPELYWFAVFGEPGPTNLWAWRVGGHHVAIQVTVAGGAVVGSTPSFLGTNPATVPHGPLAGTRTLAGEEDLARSLLSVLTPVERDVAIVSAT